MLVLLEYGQMQTHPGMANFLILSFQVVSGGRGHLAGDLQEGSSHCPSIQDPRSQP